MQPRQVRHTAALPRLPAVQSQGAPPPAAEKLSGYIPATLYRTVLSCTAGGLEQLVPGARCRAQPANLLF